MEYWPEVLQAHPTPDFKVYLYFDDGSVKLFDASEIIKGEAFAPLRDPEVFVAACTVLNDTLAFTPELDYNEETCLDLDPFVLYESCPEVDDPLE